MFHTSRFFTTIFFFFLTVSQAFHLLRNPTYYGFMQRIPLHGWDVTEMMLTLMQLQTLTR